MTHTLHDGVTVGQDRLLCALGAFSRAQQACHLHQRRTAFTECGAGQQVDVGIQAQHEQHRRAAQTAHVWPQWPSRTRQLTQHALQRAAELQEIGCHIGQHVSRHRQRQQQGPFELAPQRKIEQRHQRRRGTAYEGHPRPDEQHQQQRIERVLGQHGVDLVLQHRPTRSVHDEPRREHPQHRNGQQQTDQREQSKHEAAAPSAIVSGQECERFLFLLVIDIIVRCFSTSTA